MAVDSTLNYLATLEISMGSLSSSTMGSTSTILFFLFLQAAVMVLPDTLNTNKNTQLDKVILSEVPNNENYFVRPFSCTVTS